MSSARQRPAWRQFVAALALTSLLGACTTERPDGSPARVVQEFIQRMQSVHGEPDAARQAYELLWLEAKKNLTERAQRASAVSGRKVGPEEMLAPSAFHLAFTPRRFDTRMEGKWAIVTIRGDRAQDHAEVRCIAEGNGWRVVLEPPALTPVRKRPEPDSDKTP